MMAQGQTSERLAMGVNSAEQLFGDIACPSGKDSAFFDSDLMKKLLPGGGRTFLDEVGIGFSLEDMKPSGKTRNITGKSALAASELKHESCKVNLRLDPKTVHCTENSMDMLSVNSVGTVLEEMPGKVACTHVPKDAPEKVFPKVNTVSVQSIMKLKDTVTLSQVQSLVMPGKKSAPTAEHTKRLLKTTYIHSPMPRGDSGAGIGKLRSIPQAGKLRTGTFSLASTNPQSANNASPRQLKITAQNFGSKPYSDGKNLWRFTPGRIEHFAGTDTTGNLLAAKSLSQLAQSVQNIQAGSTSGNKRKYCTVSDYYIRYLNQPKRARHETLQVIFKDNDSQPDVLPLQSKKDLYELVNRRVWVSDKERLPGCKVEESRLFRFMKRPIVRVHSSAVSKYRVPKPKRKAQTTPLVLGSAKKVKKLNHGNQSLISMKDKFVPMNQLKWSQTLKKFVQQRNMSTTSLKMSDSRWFKFPSGNFAAPLRHGWKDKPGHLSTTGKPSKTGVPGIKKFQISQPNRANTMNVGQNATKSPGKGSLVHHRCKDIKVVLNCNNAPWPDLAVTMSEYCKMCTIFQVRKLLASKSLAASQPTTNHSANARKSNEQCKKMTSIVLLSSLTEEVLVRWTRHLPQATEIDASFTLLLGGNSKVCKTSPSPWFGKIGQPWPVLQGPLYPENASTEDKEMMEAAFSAWHYDDVEEEDSNSKRAGKADLVVKPSQSTPALSQEKIAALVRKAMHFTGDAACRNGKSGGSVNVTKYNRFAVKTLQSRTQSRSLSRENNCVKRRSIPRSKLSYCVRYRQCLLAENSALGFGPLWRRHENNTFICSHIRSRQGGDYTEDGTSYDKLKNCAVKFRRAGIGMRNGYGECGIGGNEKFDEADLHDYETQVTAAGGKRSRRCCRSDTDLGVKKTVTGKVCGPLNGFHKHHSQSYVISSDLIFKRKIGDTEIFHATGVRRFSSPAKPLSVDTEPPVHQLLFNEAKFVKKIGATEIFHKCAVKRVPPPVEVIDEDRLEKIYGRSIEELARIAWLEDSLIGVWENKSDCAAEATCTVLQPREKEERLPPSGSENCLYSLCKRRLADSEKALRRLNENFDSDKSALCDPKRVGCVEGKKATVSHSKVEDAGFLCAVPEGGIATLSNVNVSTASEDHPSVLLPSGERALGGSEISNGSGKCVTQVEQRLSNCVESVNEANSIESREGKGNMGNLLLKRRGTGLQQPLKRGTTVLSPKLDRSADATEKSRINGTVVGLDGRLSCLLSSEKRKDKLGESDRETIDDSVDAVEKREVSVESPAVSTTVDTDKPENEVETIRPGQSEDGGNEIRSSNRLRSRKGDSKMGRYEADYVADLPKAKKAKKTLPCRDYDEDSFWQFYRDCQKTEHVKNLILQHKYIRLLKSKQIECEVQPLFNGLYSQYSNVTCAKSFLRAEDPVLPENGILSFMSNFTKGRRGPTEILKPSEDGVCPYCGRSFQESEKKSELASHLERHRMRSTLLSVPRMPKRKKKRKRGRPPPRPVKSTPTKPTVVVVEPASVLQQNGLSPESTMARLGLVAAQSIPFTPGTQSMLSSVSQANLEQLKNIKAFPRPSNISMGHRRQTARKSHSSIAANLPKDKLIAALSSKATLSAASDDTKSPSKTPKPPVSTAAREKLCQSKGAGVATQNTAKRKPSLSSSNGVKTAQKQDEPPPNAAKPAEKSAKLRAVNSSKSAQKTDVVAEPPKNPDEPTVKNKPARRSRKIGLSRYAKGSALAPESTSSDKKSNPAKSDPEEQSAKGVIANGAVVTRSGDKAPPRALPARACLREKRKSSPALAEQNGETGAKSAKLERIDATIGSQKHTGSKRS